MEHVIRYRNDQFRNDDYAQLVDRWSAHPGSGYKTSPNDNTSLIYTSDYGSYSSQESNHSGTTYSNLADCEEALLRSPPYDVPPNLLSSMEKRRDKPLPPPRMTSRMQPPIKTRVLEPVKEKRISFDDSSMTKSANREKTNPNNAVPSFATLPRKKKLVNNTNANSTATQPAPQVTWMKEVAQKGEFINQVKSDKPVDSSISKQKPHGILKNKIEDQKKKGDTTGYIKRNTVQRILQQQQSALNRQSAAYPSTQFYKSMPNIIPVSQPAYGQSNRAWEYNSNDNNNRSTATAQVIGVLEPGSQDTIPQPIHHVRQNSTETEFEFPPPPSDHDIEQIMSPPPATGSKSYSSPNSDFTPLKLACHNGVVSPRSVETIEKSVTSKHGGKERPPKPPVPERSKKPVISNQNMKQFNGAPPMHREQTTPNYESTIPQRHSTARSKRTTVNNNVDNHTSPRLLNSKVANDLAVDSSSPDIVLPPPLEFQEDVTGLSTEQPSYGDYAILSPEPQYQGPTPRPRKSVSNDYNQQTYRGSISMNRLQFNIADDLKISPHHTQNSYSLPRSSHRVNGSSNLAHHAMSSNQKKSRFSNHHHQYSTEL